LEKSIPLVTCTIVESVKPSPLIKTVEPPDVLPVVGVIEVSFGIKLNVNASFCMAFPEFMICTSMPYLTPAIRPELAPILHTI